MNSQPATLYDRICVFSASRRALAIAFLWGLAEATVFFFVPDIFLGLVALFNWRKGLLSTIFVVAGAIIGGTIMYGLAANNATAMNRLLTSIPLIHLDMVDFVREQIRMNGLNALFSGLFQGIPYKIYAVQAGAQGLGLLPFLLFTIPARLARILPVALVGSIVGVVFRKYVQRNTSLVIGVYIAIWAFIYMLYYFRFR